MSTTQILASSRVRPYGERGAADVADWAAKAQAYGGFVALPWPQTGLEQAAVALAAQGLPLVGVQLPLPPEPLPSGRRVPHWASLDDAEERLAAINMANETLARAQTFGCTWAFLDAFSIKLKAPSKLFAQSYGERRWDRDRSSKVAARPLLEAALVERKEHDQRLCDAARHSLERLANVAEARGVRVAVGHGIGPWQFPSPREVDLLLEEFRGGPLVKAHVPARLDVLETIGLLTADRRTALALAPFVLASDAVGLRDDLAPGLGPTPLTTKLLQAAGKPPDVVVVSGRADTQPQELAAAVTRMKRLAALSLP
ncbi:MAG: hypothetical protein SF187_15360 [Deltaproteobacteria bacterium]|nr:hypothetical protein [Deltaproteobacteria bacterium]